MNERFANPGGRPVIVGGADMNDIGTLDAQPMVKFDRVSKCFVSKPLTRSEPPQRIMALQSLTADVRRGEVVILLGPSGCGKTTLLRMAAGLTQCSSGTVTVDGSLVCKPRKDACMVFQHFGLLPWRSVLTNIEFPLELDNVPAAERRDRARELLKLVGLERFGEHYPHQISGGMQQRVGIARALARKPILLFMDEPFGALDAQSREQLQDDFLKVLEAVGTTVLFVTHSIDEALVLGDRIFVFTPSPGRVKQIITSPVAEARRSDVRSHPAFGDSRAMLRHLLKGEEQ
jgi:NitT/TauT family transport system ATP-binding protein